MREVVPRIRGCAHSRRVWVFVTAVLEVGRLDPWLIRNG
jgi:hypothetical protein